MVPPALLISFSSVVDITWAHHNGVLHVQLRFDLTDLTDSAVLKVPGEV